MAYKNGQCIQTFKTLMVRDTNGKLNSIKPDCWMAFGVMENGTRVGLIISKEAVDQPNFDLILKNLLDPGSKALDFRGKEQLIKCGKMLKLEKAQQWKIAGKRVES